jgi:hypothetical protein
MSCCTASGTSWAEAPGRAYSPFLLRFMHLFTGHNVVYTLIVVRGSPWARHPPAGHERAPNCASAGRSGGCIARHKCSMEVGGVGERYNGVFRGPQRGGSLHLHDFRSQPSPALPSGRCGQGCLGMASFLHQTSVRLAALPPASPGPGRQSTALTGQPARHRVRRPAGQHPNRR